MKCNFIHERLRRCQKIEFLLHLSFEGSPQVTNDGQSLQPFELACAILQPVVIASYLLSSLTLCIPKTIERMIHNPLYYLAETRPLLSSKQVNFRASLSCENQIVRKVCSPNMIHVEIGEDVGNLSPW